MKASRAQVLRDMGLTPWRLRDDGPPEAGVQPSAGGGTAVADTEPADRSGQARQPEPQPTVARTEAPVAENWAELETAVSQCTRCALAQGRKQAVFGVGAHDARWLLVGEAPGAEEDRRGEPFVGRAGKLLDAMLEALRIRREDVFITNIVKCRPPGNRDPEPQEADACRTYLDKQIEWVKPELILALGRVAAQNLLGVDTSVGRLRGRVHQGPHATPLVVTYHPAYLLRTPIAKRKVWEDLKLALATAAPVAAGNDKA